MPTVTLVALIVFALTYILMMAFEKLRPYVAVTSAVLFVLAGSLSLFDGFSYSFADAVREIDWNVIMMIAGTMGTVYLFIESAMPQRMADILISRVSSVRWAVLSLSLFAGVISAFVDNVATVLMVAPVALAICKKLNISPVGPIICIAVSSNLQGAATLVGDTTSILLAKASGFDFLDFFFVDGKVGMFFVTEAGALVSALILFLMFLKEKAPVRVNTRTEVKDKFPTYLLVGTVVLLILVSFIPYEEAALPGQRYKPAITNGLICMALFAVGLVRRVILDRNLDSVKAAVKEIDYYTIVLLTGLFIVIGGIKEAGVVDYLGRLLAKLGGSSNSIFLVYTVIVWMSVVLSAFIDNIPYTATMLPVVAVLAESLSAASGTPVDARLFYCGLLCGATLGGNLTPIGASANIAGIGILRKEGHEVSSGTFMKYGVPFTLAAVTTGYILIWLIWA